MFTRLCTMCAAAALVAGCAAGSAERAPVAKSSTAPATAAHRSPGVTSALDSIAVLGHSGATGTLTDPTDYRRDARENSWATGDNPDVQSLYLRLLAGHPALEGHNYNEAVNGSSVEDLPTQVGYLLAEADPLPDLVIIQTIDNDLRCDGSDSENYVPYGEALGQVLTGIEEKIPGVQFFIVSQPVTVKRWTAWAAHHPELVGDNSGTGPCDVFDERGRPRPAGIRSMERIVGAYWAQIERVCAAHRGCFTDRGALHQQYVVTDRDVAVDLNHPSIAGHRKVAAIAWDALPAAIKDMP